MSKYLIDVNLPYRFDHWRGEEYIHQRDLNARMPDRNIWEYAKLNKLTIVTKDADFSDRIILETPPPRVIHFKTGNMKLSLFNEFISKHWDVIQTTSQNNKLVNVYFDRIEGID